MTIYPAKYLPRPVTLLLRLCDTEPITDGCIPTLDREPAGDNSRRANQLKVSKAEFLDVQYQ